MSSEQNAPEVFEYQGQSASPAQQDNDAQFGGQHVPHGMGQSKSSRRRRRKRKNKGGGGDSQHEAQTPQGVSQQGEQPQPGSVPSMQAGGGQRHIVNLNHGCDRAMPVTNFEAFVRAAKGEITV